MTSSQAQTLQAVLCPAWRRPCSGLKSARWTSSTIARMVRHSWAKGSIGYLSHVAQSALGERSDPRAKEPGPILPPLWALVSLLLERENENCILCLLRDLRLGWANYWYWSRREALAPLSSPISQLSIYAVTASPSCQAATMEINLPSSALGIKGGVSPPRPLWPPVHGGC